MENAFSHTAGTTNIYTQYTLLVHSVYGLGLILRLGYYIYNIQDKDIKCIFHSNGPQQNKGVGRWCRLG